MESNNNPSISSEPVAPKKMVVKKAKPDIQLPKTIEPEPTEIKEVATEKPKRGQSEKTKAALAEGRKKLAEVNKQRKADREALIEEKINKKAERIAEQKVKMLKDLKLDEEDSDGEITATPVKKAKAPIPTPTPVIKKKPAKRVIYVDEEESEEEEEQVVYRTRPAPKKKVVANSVPTPAFSGIQFY
jgi:membrane protein involved in colicin uptake